MMTQRGMRNRRRNITTSILLRSALVLLLVLIFIPHVATWFWGSDQNSRSRDRSREGDTKDEKSSENKHSAMAKMKKKVISLEEKLQNMNEHLEIFKSSVQNLLGKNKQQISELEKKIEKISDDNVDLFERISEIEKGLREHGETGVRLEKKSEDNVNQIKKVEVKTYWVDILLVIILFILLIYITMTQRNGGARFKHHKNTQLERRPAVVCFNPSSLEAHRELADLFLDDYSFIIIYDYNDIPRIHSKVVFLFVDFNDRFETLTETEQIETETVQAIRKMEGTPVLIYRLHSDSRNLGERELYCDTLTSIEYHPILRELLIKDCVLSIDTEFTDYQQRHLKQLCENNL